MAQVITETSDLLTAVGNLRSSPHIGLDIETTSLDPYDGRLRLVSIADEDGAFLIDADYVKNLTPLWEFLRTKKVIIHNAKFDLKWIKKQYGVELGTIFDTLLASQIVSAGTLDHRHSLAAVALRYLNQHLDKTEQQSDWSGKLTESQLNYAERDASILLPLRKVLIEKLKEENLIRCAALEFEALSTVVDLELNGIFLDKERWREQLDRSEKERAILHDKLQDILGETKDQQTLFWKQAINLNSPLQLKEALNKLGVPVTESTLNWKLKPLAEEYPIVQTLMDYRVVEKQLTSFGENILGFIHPVTGRVHPDFRQIGAPTGRFSCQNPNVQQIPHIAGYRRCFRPLEGKKYVISDYSQIELRILAEFSQDPKFIEAFKSGIDFHTLTATQLFNADVSKITKEQRSFAKNLNFGVVYGIGPNRFSKVTGTTFEKAAGLIKRYFKTYPILHRWLEQAASDTIHTGHSRTASGRLVFFFGDRKDPSIASMIGRNGKNTPIQGTGADILKRALFLLHGSLSSGMIVNVVHDEIVVEVDEADAEQAAAEVGAAMRQAGEEYLKSVPCEVTTMIADEWVK